jgi:hypothetical protein
MRIEAIILGISAALLNACASPLAVPKPPSFQEKVTHSADWSALAGRTASHFVRSVGLLPSAVYVAPGPSDMPFASAFRNLLEQELLERGVRVQETATGATVLRFEVQPYWYMNERQKLLGDYASFWTTAAALGAQARNITSVDTALAVAGGTGPVLDILWSMFDTTNAEVTLTVTVFDGQRLTYRNGNTFYIRPTELPFYWSQVPGVVPQARPIVPQEVALPVRGGH